MGKQVKVVTKCGEIHHYEYNQEVETVEIVEPIKPITHINAKLSAIVRALVKYNAKNENIWTGVYAGDNENEPRGGHNEKTLIITFTEKDLQNIMQLIQETPY